MHLRTTQGDHTTQRLVFTQLETSDSLLSLGNHRLLTSNLSQIGHGVVHHFFISNGLNNPHVKGDLSESRHLHRRLVPELLNQRGSDFFTVMLLQTRHGHATLISVPLDL